MIRHESIKIEGKQLLSDGDEFKVPHRGRFVFRYATESEPSGDISITGYGGRAHHEQWSSFKPEQVRVKRLRNVRGNTSKGDK